jgi:hypothetical protein
MAEMGGAFMAGSLVMVYYIVSADRSEVTFTVSVPSEVWLSLGVSTDGTMDSSGDGAVCLCVESPLFH